MHRKYGFSTLMMALGLCGALGSVAHAQPDPNAAGKGDNPNNLNMGGGPGGRGGMGGRRQMTPEQQKQMRAQQTERRIVGIKQQLTQAGYTDEATQTAVVNAFKEQAAAQDSLAEQLQKINQGVRAKMPDAQMATLLSDFRAAVDKETERRTAAYKTLDDQIGLSTKPLLDAVLMTMGLTGNEAAIAGQSGGRGMGGPGGGMGGPGGGMGGGFGGGPGGFGGGMGGPGGDMGGFGGGPGGFGGGGGNSGGGGFGGGPGGDMGGPGGGFDGGPGGDMGGPPGPPPDDNA